MPASAESATVRRADLTGPDGAAVSRLVEAYLLQTELEKASRLGGAEVALPARYRDEIDHPALAYENAVVHLAEFRRVPMGVVVVQRVGGVREIKRVWVDPRARGRRIGSRLIDAALRERDLPIRLTVWQWRGNAIRLYRRHGFVTVPSWDTRRGLVCMELAAAPVGAVNPVTDVGPTSD
jgi:ribosomal protein S18 acetylase RimI-like enzyme